jgi:type IV secretion system protein VirB5
MANLMQAIVQVQAWEQQYIQMMQTIKQQEDFIKNATGSRGLGLIANAITGTALPPDIQNIITQATDYASLNQIAMQQYATLNQALQTRSGQIQQLMAQINATTDAKSIQELTARIQAEQVMAANEGKEAEWLRAQVETQSRILDQQLIQKQIDRLH